jgi:hypothetical protein
MKKISYFTFSLILILLSIGSKASSLFEDSISRGINEQCSKYLDQVEKSYGLNGLNLTFAHPVNPSNLPSLHISSQKYNNGSSLFSATLTPDEENCYLSTLLVTSVNNQQCSEIVNLKTQTNPKLKVSSYLDSSYIILTPPDESYQVILTSSNEMSCTMTEIRMMWPGN